MNREIQCGLCQSELFCCKVSSFFHLGNDAEREREGGDDERGREREREREGERGRERGERHREGERGGERG